MMNATNTETVKTERTPKLHAGYDHRGMAVAPVGPVKLSTGANATFGSIFHCWAENSGTIFLLDYGHDYKVVYTSGTMESVWVGDLMVLKNDQTWRTLPGEGKVIAKGAYNKDTFEQFRAVSGKSSIKFYTFK